MIWKDVLPAWKKTHPDWEIKFWSDSDNDEIMKKHFSWFLDTYNNFPYKIQKCDTVRACYLYIHGGVYVDMDYLPKKNISPIFENTNNEIYLTLSATISDFTNSFMASKPKSQYWIEYLKSIQNDKVPWYYNRHFQIIAGTGPMRISNVAKKYKKVIGFLPSTLINACTMCDKYCEYNNDDNVYLITLEGSSWTKLDSQMLSFIYCNMKTVIIISLVLLFLIIYFIVKTFRKYKKDLYVCSVKLNRMSMRR
jgi:mannosyltransferase OCH1-like enzyme